MSFLGYLREARETLTPIVEEEGAFLSKGVLSPSEYIQAGDHLTALCPIWTWCCASKPSLSRNFLPTDKQYLVARNVVSEATRGARNEGDKLVEEGVDEEDDGVVVIGERGHPIDEKFSGIKPQYSTPDDQEQEGELGAMSFSSPDEETRFFTLIISYDRYYRTPRVFFTGYDRNGQVLENELLLEDVFSEENASKMVTIERFPLTGQYMAAIHPCQHGAAVVRISQRCVENGMSPSVEHYLFIFLKLLRSILPFLAIPDLMEIAIGSKVGAKETGR